MHPILCQLGELLGPDPANKAVLGLLALASGAISGWLKPPRKPDERRLRKIEEELETLNERIHALDKAITQGDTDTRHVLCNELSAPLLKASTETTRLDRELAILREQVTALNQRLTDTLHPPQNRAG